MKDLLPFDAPVAVVVAHPDDETIGAGCQLARFRRLTLVHVTNGAPRDGKDAAAAGFPSRELYAAARRRELDAALAAGSVAPARLLSLGYVDQEAVFSAAEIARRLADIFTRHGIGTVLTHAYEGGHPDHDALAFAVARAAPPRIVEMAEYNKPTGYGRFLGDPGAEVRLSPEERERKRRMVACFTSQARILAPFPLDRERFRIAPRYDFTAPPHEGPLWYEEFGWAIEGAQWRRLIAAC